VKAQILYDLRSEVGFCDGQTLHRFFEGETGDPSPSGYVEINEAEAVNLVKAHLAKMRHNSAPTHKTVVEEMRQLTGKMGRFASKCI
jgi:hypothetical protein